MSTVATLRGPKERRLDNAGVRVCHDMIYCGQEGFLTLSEIARRTDEAVMRYAQEQPLRFRLGKKLLPSLVQWQLNKNKQPKPKNEDQRIHL